MLELVEGPTLADRIKQGPIPVDEALPIAKQIAEALEAAHAQGVTLARRQARAWPPTVHCGGTTERGVLGDRAYALVAG